MDQFVQLTPFIQCVFILTSGVVVVAGMYFIYRIATAIWD